MEKIDKNKEYENEIYWLREELSFYKNSRLISSVLALKEFFKKLKAIITYPYKRLKDSAAHRLTDRQKKIIRNLLRLEFLRIKIAVKNERYDGPIVSIITPFYNNGATIMETYESVMGQTLQNFEYIVVDDGSDDDNKTILKGITDERARIIHHPENLGKGSPAAARNTGIGEAKGKYVLCLDADDIIDPTYLEKLVFVLENDPNASIAIPDMERFGAGDGTYSFGRFIPEKLISKSIVSTASLFRREAWEAVGGYKEGIGYEDWEFWVSLAEHGFWGRHVNEPLLHYRTALSSRYVDDLPLHKNNVKKIHSLHRFYWLKIKVIRLKKFIFKKVLTGENRYVNLGSSLDLRDKKKVLVLLPWLTFGGAERLTLNFCGGLKDDYDFSFITVLKSNNEWQQRFSMITSRIYHLVNLLDSRADYYNFLRQYIELNSVEIVHVVHVGYLFDAFEVSKMIKADFPHVKIIFTFFNSEVPLFSKVHKAQDVIDVVTTDSSEVEGEYLKSFPRDKVRLIQSGIDTAKEYNDKSYNREKKRAELGLKSSDVAVLYVGRLATEKNIEGMLSVIEDTKVDNVKYFIAGNGAQQSLVEGYRGKNMKYLGYRDDVPELLSATDIFLLTSWVEGLPQTVVEAMSMGRAVVSSSVGSIPNVVKSMENGITFKAGDMTSARAAVELLAKDTKLLQKLSISARDYARENCDITKMIAKYKHLYDSLEK